MPVPNFCFSRAFWQDKYARGREVGLKRGQIKIRPLGNGRRSPALGDSLALRR